MEAEHVSGKGIARPEKRSACPGEWGRPAPGRLSLGGLSGEAGLVHPHCSWRFLSQAEEFKLHAI